MSGAPEPQPGDGKKNAGAQGWALEPHVCRECFSRLLTRETDAGTTRVYCPNCGLLADGPVQTLCACGIEVMRDGAYGKRRVSAGLRCRSNPNPTPDFPSLFVAVSES